MVWVTGVYDSRLRVYSSITELVVLLTKCALRPGVCRYLAVRHRTYRKLCVVTALGVCPLTSALIVLGTRSVLTPGLVGASIYVAFVHKIIVPRLEPARSM